MNDGEAVHIIVVSAIGMKHVSIFRLYQPNPKKKKNNVFYIYKPVQK